MVQRLRKGGFGGEGVARTFPTRETYLTYASQGLRSDHQRHEAWRAPGAARPAREPVPGGGPLSEFPLFLTSFETGIAVFALVAALIYCKCNGHVNTRHPHHALGCLGGRRVGA